jgi:methionine--tRNA ligase beta chain
MHFDLTPGLVISEPKTLFRKIEDPEIKAFRERFSGSQKKEVSIAKFDKFPADLRVGVVTDVSDHPEAGKLYVLKVNLGSETRQLVAGIKPYIARDQLLGKHIIVVCNLKHAKLRGVESQGMLLAADANNKVILLEAPGTDAGDEVVVEGVDSEEEFAELDINQFFRVVLETDADGCIVCKNFSKKLKTPVEYVKAKGLGAGAKIR